MSTQAQKTFDLSRKEASGMLKVSTRTLDRYIKSKKLSSKNIAGRIMLNRDEVFNIKKGRPHRKIKKINESYIQKEQPTKKEDTEEKIYQKLYEEMRIEMKVFQQRLEGANYRVGQLESQVKSSVPLLEHQKVLTGAKKERYNKKILYILLGAVLALQPLWLLLAYF